MSIFGGIGSWIERHCGELQLGIWMSLMMCLPHQRRKVYIKDKFDKHSQAAKDNQKYPKVVTNWAKWEHVSSRQVGGSSLFSVSSTNASSSRLGRNSPSSYNAFRRSSPSLAESPCPQKILQHICQTLPKQFNEPLTHELLVFGGQSLKSGSTN